MKENAQPKLVVALIGDKCQRTLRLCLDSIKDVADMIVFVWGKEEIETNNILETEYDFKDLSCLNARMNSDLTAIIKYSIKDGNKIIIPRRYEHEHKGANGRARNCYLDFVKKHCNGWWCIVIDPDEIVQNPELIRNVIKETEDKVGKEKTIVLNPKMRHLIGDLAHEDCTREEHFAPGRFFRVSQDLYYEECEHPVTRSKNKEFLWFHCRGFVIWHLAHAMEMFNILHRYKTHTSKSQIHSSEFLSKWYWWHITGAYPKAGISLNELPDILKHHFLLEETK